MDYCIIAVCATSNSRLQRDLKKNFKIWLYLIEMGEMNDNELEVAVGQSLTGRWYSKAPPNMNSL